MRYGLSDHMRPCQPEIKTRHDLHNLKKTVMLRKSQAVSAGGRGGYCKGEAKGWKNTDRHLSAA